MSASIKNIPYVWCPVEATIDVVGGKWKALILFQLTRGPCRFNALRRLLPHVTQRMMTLQLRALEEDGVISRSVQESVPPKVEYALTERGWALAPIFEAMQHWGTAHGARRSEPA